MTKLAFQLKPGDIFLATPINEFVTLQEIVDEGLGRERIVKTSNGSYQVNPYEKVTTK